MSTTGGGVPALTEDSRFAAAATTTPAKKMNRARRVDLTKRPG
jgi:hypothetical protein